MTKTSDIIIIGGGMAGVSAAAKLSPHASVTVLEREPSLGYHSTGRSAAIFIRNYGNATLRALNVIAEPEFIEPIGISDRTLLSPRGQLLFGDDSEIDKLQSYADGSDGLVWLSQAETLEMVPILRIERVASSIYEHSAQEIDVDRMLQGYARLARANGAQIELAQGVESVGFTEGIWTLRTAKDTFQAPVVINAAGAWADNLAVIAGLGRMNLSPLRRSAVMIPSPTGYDTGQWPVFADIAETFYAKPGAGRIMISPADEDPVEPHDAWAEDMVLAEGIDRYERAVTVPVTRVERNWAGLRTFAPDRTPVVGFDRRAQGFFWLAGQGGYGIQTAPALSQITADLVLGRAGSIKADILAAIAPDRFLDI
ncbi:MAG: FAD-dependent oxidoreductase [Rhodobacterales bacterium]|jgi:D-arginine dehydrogenase|nr:FAD-dependent oxidoreductase [Pseudomonadota bacterium]MDA1285623.1 FAD-dependent oxidoreductase [Pseudomonadota bacterium]NQW14243.1 FAD-binding oxidoreductase [Rhodobacter sp.]